MSTLVRAIQIAVYAHYGQSDKVGEPYILHPLRVMLAAEEEETRIVAILHDVAEDCEKWPLERIAAEGFSASVVNALEYVTRREGEGYEMYIMRCGFNTLATCVKILDLEDNLSRIHKLAGEDRARLQPRYSKALAYLVGSPYSAGSTRD